MKQIYSALTLLAVLGMALLGCGPSKPELYVYSWGGIFKPSVIEAFEKKHQCIVHFNYYESNEAMYAKLKAGATGYDVLVPSSYFIQIMQDQDLIEKIHPERIPNLKYLNQDLLAKINAPYSPYCVPYSIGYTGIGYRKDKLPHLDHSWTVFSQKDLKGRMTMLNDRREVLGAALKTLGFSSNTTDAEEIKQAQELAIEWKRNLAKFEGEQYKNGLNSAEYLLVQGFSLDVLQIQEENPNVDFFYPKEGVQIFLDTLAIPANAPSIDLAYQFIDFLFEPEIAAENMAFICNLILNNAAYPLLSEKLRENPALFIPEEMLLKSELILDLGKAIKLYNAAWENILEAD